MANEKQIPQTETDVYGQEPLPAGALPAPMVDENFNPYENEGDMWLYKESFVNGVPDTILLGAILQRETLQRQFLAGHGSEDHREKLQELTRSIHDYKRNQNYKTRP